MSRDEIILTIAKDLASQYEPPVNWPEAENVDLWFNYLQNLICNAEIQDITAKNALRQLKLNELERRITEKEKNVSTNYV